MSFIDQEVREFRAKCEKQVPHTKIIICSNSLIRVDIYPERPNRSMSVCLRFPENYPRSTAILVELKSRIYSDKLLSELTRLIDKYIADHMGKPQALLVLSFAQQYLSDNPLCVCLDEIKQLRADIKATGTTTGSQLKLKQKNRSVELVAKEASTPTESPLSSQTAIRCRVWSCATRRPIFLPCLFDTLMASRGR